MELQATLQKTKCEKEALRNKVKTLESKVHDLEIREQQYIEEIRKLKKYYRY